MRLGKLHTVKKLAKDPFMLLIALVVLIPAVLVVYGASNQSQPHPAVNSVSREATKDEPQTSSANTGPVTQQPITEAEQPEVFKEKQPVPEPAPICDAAKKQATEDAKNTQVAQENTYHQKQLDKIRLISRVYRKYWDEEMLRHQNALNQIEATYKASLDTSNC